MTIGLMSVIINNPTNDTMRDATGAVCQGCSPQLMWRTQPHQMWSRVPRGMRRDLCPRDGPKGALAYCRLFIFHVTSRYGIVFEPSAERINGHPRPERGQGPR